MCISSALHTQRSALTSSAIFEYIQNILQSEQTKPGEIVIAYNNVQCKMPVYIMRICTYVIYLNKTHIINGAKNVVTHIKCTL